ncbi:long-chain fatty acid--CoA ligase [Arthrobacter sp. I2-34]|uniref:Long-chain fatty acid--CoA ligase n=1 Tax=Arthrobacter hankyongi TaxID=2904801 RepID=A0ABS9LDK5_9MICC|nr:long-chain fatty acid--CoA ligase [Arthrobacter hankyongi]MCG2624760.1 long-chain fatty acid--CoA ligase [Arthrobacter hankyongi]
MHNQGVGTWIHRRRVKSAGRTALISGGAELSYDEFAERVDRLASALAARGIAKGSRVAYLGENHPAFLETFFACGTLGAVFVPLNTRLAPPEIEYALQDSGSSILVHARSLDGLAVPGSRKVELTHRIVVADAPATDAAADAAAETPAGAAVEDFEQAITAGSPEHRDVEVTLEDPAMILYTSGTTGRPKGALLTHGNMTWNSVNVLVDYDMVSSDVALMIAPMFHVASLGMGVLPALLKGATVILEPRFEPGRTLHLIEQYRATSISGVPTTYQMLCEHPDWDKTDISSLTKLTCGGSAVPMRVLEAYESRGLSFSGGYGMTETAPGATSLAPNKSREKAGSAGLPHFFTDIRITNVLGEATPAGSVGEIQISGPNVIKEYWNRPDATADSYADGVWFKSGDMGYVDEEGYLYISDRLKDMIISGGENIYPAEVEQHIAELEAVGSVAVIGVPDEKWGEVPRAIVTVRNGYSLTEEEIRTQLQGRLARYKIPKSVVIVEELPRTASGKIRKAELRKQYSG